ncbi:hypothetical protein LCGC14_2776670, partial [marine sediment metagenome]
TKDLERHGDHISGVRLEVEKPPVTYRIIRWEGDRLTPGTMYSRTIARNQDLESAKAHCLSEVGRGVGWFTVYEVED